MIKKQIDLKQESQELKYPDAKPAQKAEHYEDFTILAERLRKEGKLDEVNYKRLVRKFWIANSFLAGLMLLGVSLTIGGNDDFLYFLMLGGLVIWGMIRYRLDLNRYCYLFNFGEVTEGKIVEVNKYERNNSHIYLFCLNKNALFDYFTTFVFKDKSGNSVTLIQQDVKKFRPKKFYKVGDRVTVYYNPNNSSDALIEAKENETNFNKKHYNLLLTLK